MNPIKKYPIFNNIRFQTVFNFGDASQKKTYFQSARTSEAFFSFLSGPIFKKELWDHTDIPESFRGTCWIVAGHLLRMISAGITINYLGKTLLHKREGNDSFSGGSIVNRHRITIESFQHVANFVFGKQSEEAFHIRRVLHLDCPFSSLLYAKLKTAENPDKEDITTLNRIAKMHYSDPCFGNWVRYTIYNNTPFFALMVLYRLKNWVKNIKRNLTSGH
jgi:abequosyltransferase